MGSYWPFRQIIRSTSLGIALILAFSMPAFGHFKCGRLFDRQKIGQPETSIEIELPLTEQVAAIITTQDGTLRPLFSHINQIPSDVRQDIQKLYSDFDLMLDFNSLPRALKLRILKFAIPAMNLEFKQAGNRKIPGLALHPLILERYPFQNFVEFGTPQSVRTAGMIELHMRKDGDASDLIQSAKLLHKSLGYSHGSIHMHVVAKQDKSWLKKNPIVNSFLIADYWRRLNLVMEMRDVIERKATIYYSSFVDSGITYNNFGPLDSASFAIGLQYFLKQGQLGGVYNLPIINNRLALGSDAKIAWVGLWGHDKYDSPESFGFEFRSLRTNDTSESLLQFLNQVRERVENHQFGVDETTMTRWLDHLETVASEKEGYPTPWRRDFSKDKFTATLESPFGIGPAVNYRLVPHKPYEEVMSEVGDDMRKLILGMGREEIKFDKDGFQVPDTGQEKFLAHFTARKRLSYILHDWSLDPLFFEKPDEAKKIKQLQLRALRRWMRGEDEALVIQDFLLDSGVYFALAESVGFNP